jgi:Lrp/AsnC family leucine-responsive transcriptional regulator
MDEIDTRLLHRLAEELPLDFSGIAADIGTTEQDAAIRFSRLKDAGVIQECAARLDPSALGIGLTAFVLIRLAQTGDDYDVVRQLFADLEVVEEAHAISGEFDWVIKVRVASLTELQEVVTHRLSFVPGFVRAQTWMVLDSACNYVNADRVRLVGQ